MSINKFAFTILCCLIFAQNWLAAQCPVTVNAGPDQLACSTGETVTLLGSLSGTYLGFGWSPATGLNDPNLLNPMATVTGPATYTLTAQAINPAATNLVVNPGFESGNSGFTSVYTYNALPITPGTYVLTTSPALVLASFPPCDDHTFGNGTGNMMLVNGTASTGTQVWCQTINVSPNTWYVMSGWAMASPISPPTLQFSVNGVLVGDPYAVGTGTCNWQQFSASWYSGSATTAQLCVTDQVSGGNGFFGDDYALDDIFFVSACTVTDQVNVNIATVNANSPATIVLPCNAAQSGIVLSGAGSSTGPDYSYQWNGPGILSGANSINATVNQEGLYTLTVTFNTGTCTDESTTLVLPDPNVVVAVANTTETLTCLNPTALLDGTGSSMGGTISYNWQPSAGVIAGQGTLMPEVNQQGLYTLTVSNSTSGCTATATVFMNQNNTVPIASAAAPTPLSCTMNAVALSGMGSSVGPNFDYLWTGSGIVSGAGLLNNCVVNLPGQYLLTVTNTSNGCTATATATVTQNGTPPTAVALTSGNLNCTNPTASLSSTGSSNGPGISYAWSTANGHFASSTNGATTTVDSTGTYILTVTNTANGCSATASVSVTANFVLPSASIATSIPMLNCLTDSVQLNASQSSSGAGFTFVWASQNGMFFSGQSTLTPWVGSAGVYTLIIGDTASGCTTFASATVTENSTPPIAQAGPNATLDCNGTAVTLNGSGSSTGVGIGYQWTTTGGHIISGDLTLTPDVDGVGLYILLVENSVNGCTTLDSVAVSQDVNAPTVQIDLPGQLDCLTDTVTLDASGSSAGANITLTWSGPGLASGQGTYTPSVVVPGVYSLTLLNQSNNCQATASVMVAIDTLPPVADAGPAPDLDCTMQSGILDGSGSSQGPTFISQWSTGDTILTPTISAAGTYTLTITNGANGCTASDAVTVVPFGNLPDVDIMTPGSLSCSTTQLQLSATASVGAAYSYNWTFAGTGTGIISGDTTLTLTIGSAGSYTLTVTNTLTNCTASESVQVLQNADQPTVVVNGSQTLICGLTSIQINGVGMSPNGVSYEWSTQNGNMLSGAATPNLMLNAPGTYTLTVTDLLSGCTASDDVLVNQDANAPIANAGATQSLTCSMLSVMLDGSASSNGPDIAYSWTTSNGTISFGETTLTPTVTAPGTYLLTVTNTLNNCQSLAGVQVTDFSQQPDAIIAPAVPLNCFASTTTLDATSSSTGPEYAYQWVGPGTILGGNTLLPTVNTPGVFTLQVTNTVTECSATAQVTVGQNTAPPTALAASLQDLTCIAQQVQLNGAGSSTGAVFNYQWVGPGIIDGGTTLTPSANLPGTYTLTVTNSATGCTATSSTVLNQNTTPPVAVAAATQSLDCMAQQVALNGMGSSSGAGFDYLWAGPGIVSGGNTLSPQVDAPGLYTLTVTNQANGCMATASVTVNQTAVPPIAFAAQPPSLTCTMLTVSLDGTGSSIGAGIIYSWAGPGIVGSTTLISTIADMAGTYTLTVSNQGNGCSATTQVMVDENVMPPIADAGSATTLSCGQVSIALVGTSDAPDASFIWTTTNGSIALGNATANPVVDAPGTYVLEVTNLVNGCTALDSTVVTATFAVFPQPGIIPPTCAKPLGIISFTGGQGGAWPFGYSLDGGATFTQDSIFENLQPTNYEVIVQDANGCQREFVLTVPDASSLVVTLAASASLHFGEAFQLYPLLGIPVDQVATVSWLPAEGLSCTDCLQPIATPTADITYILVITSVDGCTASASIDLSLVVPEGHVYVPNALSPNDDGINDVLTVFADEKAVTQVVNFRVFTRWGESVYAGSGFLPNDVSHGWDGSFRGKKVESGVYVWFVEVELAALPGQVGERKQFKGDVVVVR